MATVTFVTHSGEKIDVQAETGQSLMQAAHSEGVDGILAECGGSCSCATCHVILDEHWMKQLGEPEALEANMLEFADGASATSRLSCQIEVTEQLDGMIVHVGGEAPSRPTSQVSQVIEEAESEAASSSDHDIFSLEDPQLYLDPARHEIFAALRKHNPVYWRALGEHEGYWVISRYQDIVAICSDPATYSSAQGAFFTGNDDPTLGAMLTTDPPRHNEMRRAVSSFFANDSLRSLEDWLRDECKLLVESAFRPEGVEFVYDVAAHLPLNVIGKIMELPKADRAKLLRLADGMVKASEETPEALAEAVSELAGFALSYAELRRGKEGADLISAMLSIGGREQTQEEFASMFMQLAVAALETTRSTLANIVAQFGQNPELMEQFRAPGVDLNVAINEFLRYYLPVNNAMRTATRDHEFGGQAIKTGDKLVLLYASANFDEEVFDQPLVFDISRHPNPHLTFGVGQHLCLGFRLARLELRVFLEEFLRQVERVELLAEPQMEATVLIKLMQSAQVKLERPSVSVGG
ncbi:MAG: cytochrome P450 [Gammaproteobacteria bacterium]|nr:cytochrome P450 [Gammaproteobacteria bacterium]